MVNILLVLLSATSWARELELSPDAKLDFTDLCQSKGYKVDSHWVTTEDGYILRVYRIGTKGHTEFNQATPVLLQHGLIDASDNWVVNSEELAPGFILANHGYDVWLGNTRGNRHSQNNTHLHPSQKEFWEYSWDQMAKFDIPAEIDYVLKATGYEKLVYVGHSQGTTDIMALLSAEPDFAAKLDVAILLAPVASLLHMESTMGKILLNPIILDLLGEIGITHGLDFANDYILSYACEMLPLVCQEGLFYFSDMDLAVDNVARLPVIMGHYPSGTSLQNLRHWSQMATRKTPGLQMYDYGSSDLNIQRYGVAEAPQYDLSKIKGKIGLFGGEYDRLADMRDVAWLKDQLTSADVVWFKNTYPLGHGTFMWALDMDWFDDVLAVIEECTKA